jgi:hypothetical protein
MVTTLLVGFLATLAPQQGANATFSDATTAELYARARVRHIRQDSLVRDYTAMVDTRVDAAGGRSRFARLTTLMVRETVARVTWRQPNDLKVEALGARAAAPIFRIVAGMSGDADREIAEGEREFGEDVWFDRPWFIPRALGDSVRLMGLPDRAALHPLATRATDHYRFSITDSVQISVPGRNVRAVKMRVEPKELSPSVVAGDMWIDQETGDVVRLMVVFVGEYLWDEPDGTTPEDSAKARGENQMANRVLNVEADIEYALIENRYWLPHRQLLALTVEIPWFMNATIPIRFISNFKDYEVNTDPAIHFAVPLDSAEVDGERRRTETRLRVSVGESGEESGNSQERSREGYFRTGLWADGRWEMEVPPTDTLLSYAWDTDFQISLDQEEERHFRESLVSLAKLSEELPAEWVGRSPYGLAWERFSDIARFNRVQGLSLGVGYQVRPGPAFTTVHAGARFGIGDRRPTASLAWRRDGPGGLFNVLAYRDVFEFESWTSGQSVGNSLNAIFTGHDDADYYLALGGGFSYQWNVGFFRDIEFTARIERHRSMETEVGAPVPGIWGPGTFQPNSPVAEGTYYRARVRRPISVGPATLVAGGDLLGSDSLLSARVWGTTSIPFGILRRTGTLTLRAGAGRGDAMSQLAFRVGGPHTVRGYEYGTRTGREFWSAQLDFAVARSPFWAPVVFVDVGDTFTAYPLIGAGAGLSLVNGMLRFNFSKGVRPSNGIRFDLAFSAAR